MWWRGLPPRQRPQAAPPHHSHLPYPRMLLEIALVTDGRALTGGLALACVAVSSGGSGGRVLPVVAV
jgi:hypothetical protein